MKKMTYFVMALAMVLGFTQCKKEQLVEPTENEGVFITLDVDGGNNGNSKVVVNPTGHTNPDYATVTFEEGDSIFVGYHNAYVGVLRYQGGSFSGQVDISTTFEGEHLHFYFLGGKEFRPTFNEFGELSVNISDQTVRYPVISYAPSRQAFTGAGSYSAKLQNKVSIMKFNVTTPSSAAICITGMNNTVSVNFETPNGTDNGFSYDKDATDGGLIKMPGKDAEGVTWAIVLPQEEVPAGTAGTAYTADGMCTGTRPAIAGIGSNQYLSGGVNMTVNETTPIATPLTFEAITSGNITVSIGGTLSTGMKYSKNGGQKGLITTTTTIDVVAGDKVQFYGNGTSTQVYGSSPTVRLQGTAQTKVYGNIMSLIDEDDYAACTTLQGRNQAFMGLFASNANLTDASGLLLPATTLATGCYATMFLSCTSLTTAPTLPAETLANHCYNQMFNGCTKLNSVTCLATNISAANCLFKWLINAGTNATSPKLYVVPSMTEATWNNGSFTVTAIP